jgi:hypothetical protein
MRIFFLMTVAIFVMTVAVNAADQRGEEQLRVIDQILCISRRMFSLLTPVLLPAGSFCTVILVLHYCSFCSLLGAVIPHLAGRNCHRLGHILSS